MISKILSSATAEKRPPLWTSMYIRLGIATIVLTFMEQMMTTNMSVYLEDLGTSASVSGVVITAFTLSCMVLRFLSGSWVDRYGRLKICMIGLYISIFPLLGLSFFKAIWAIFLFRVILGAGYSASSLALGTMSADVPAPERMDEGVGYYGLFYSIASAFGPAVGLWVSAKFGYRNMFLLCTAVIVVEVFLSRSLNYEKKRGITYERPKQAVRLPLKERLIEKTALPTTIVCFVICVAYCIINSFMAVYARSVGIEGTGMFFMILAAMTFIGRLVSGSLIKKRKRVVTLLLGIGGLTLGLLILMLMRNSWQMYLGGAVFGFGAGYVWPALAVLAVCDAASERRGTANSTYYAGYDLGLSVGSLIGGVIAQFGGYRVVCIFCTVLMAVSAGVSCLIFKDKLRKEIKSADEA